MKKKTVRTKQDGLNSKKNCRLLTFYIEDFANYIDGYKSLDGKQAIRPLTDEEKDWLGLFSNNEYCSHFFKDQENLITDRYEQKQIDAAKYKYRMDALNMYHRDGSEELEFESNTKYSPEDKIGMLLLIPVIIRKFIDIIINFDKVEIVKMKSRDKAFITVSFKELELGERVYEFSSRDNEKIKAEIYKLIADLCMVLASN